MGGLSSIAQRATIDVLKQDAAAHLLSLRPRVLRDSDAPRNPDGTYCGPALVKWAVQRALTDADPLMSGGSSPALEQYRQEKAREAKRRNDTAESLLLDASALSQQLGEIGRVFREEAAAIERVHGVAVGDLIRAAVDRAEAGWRLFAATSSAPKEPAAKAAEAAEGEPPREHRHGRPVITPEEAAEMEFPFPPEDEEQNIVSKEENNEPSQ